MDSKYRERIVAFIDILGFSQLVESVNSNNMPDKILDDLETALDEDVLKLWREEKGYELDEEHTIKMVSVQADFAKLPAGFINDGAGTPSR